ncbi:ImmA/IrrE family metallo-endopeptidase [Halobacillus trueperi]|uniref:ImmA/IrrE family metallo-endopeptidase n=1 Tax=Halobacillus trueperi TaxID=156205 RepID=A0A3D8VLH7_9BACI|nr:ImmA/IrrE family metallo-endopeptidase [Halobacillus trueperi]RDY70279.1 ImmA/IrrE family metallo-endopeptidase [Halobacillus trueperi]
MKYMTTSLENWMNTELHALALTEPEHLDNLKGIADLYGILFKVHDKPSVSGMFLGVKIIKVDSRVSVRSQRQQFFHELGHVLFHYGDQQHLPRTFVEYQEFKARNFALHYAVPTFMLHELDFPKYRTQAIHLISETFQVTYSFAQERLRHYENQLTGAIFYEELYKTINNSSGVIEEEPSIDVYSDVPFSATPEFNDFVQELKSSGLTDDEIKSIIRKMKIKKVRESII